MRVLRWQEIMAVWMSASASSWAALTDSLALIGNAVPFFIKEKYRLEGSRTCLIS
jgi:hypothetical protein